MSIDQAKQILADAVQKTDIDANEYAILNSTLEAQKSSNAQIKKELFDAIDRVLVNASPEEKILLRALRSKFENDYKVVEVAHVAQSAQIQNQAVSKRAELRAHVSRGKTEARSDEKREDEKIKDGNLDARIRLLSDLDGESGVERRNAALLERGDQRYVVGEMQLYNILKNEIGSAEGLNRLIERLNSGVAKENPIPLTWETDTSYEEIRTKFRDALLSEANRLARISRVVLGNKDATAGLVSIIQGTQEAYLTNLTKDPKALRAIKAEAKSDSSFWREVGSTLISIGISATTLGLVHTSIEHRDLEDGGHPLSAILGDRQNFTAKLRLVGAEVQGNWNDRETRIIEDTKKFATALENANPDREKAVTALVIPEGTTLSKTEQELVNFYNTHCNKLPDGSKQVLIDELARTHMNSLVNADSGLGFKGVAIGANLLSISAYGAVVGQNISTRIRESAASGATYAESRTKLRPADLKDLGVTQAKLADGRKGYFLDIDAGDIAGLGGMASVEKDGDQAKVFIASDEPLDFHQETVYLSDGGVEKKLSISTRSQDATPITAVSFVTRDAQEGRGIDGLRNIGDTIYKMSRNKKQFPDFDLMFQEIGKGNYGNAFGMLSNMKYPVAQKLASLVKAPHTEGKTSEEAKQMFDEYAVKQKQLLQAINTYTYGGVEKNKGTLDLKGYTKTRTSAVKIAEGKIPGEVVVPNESAEAEFAKQPNHTRKHLRDFDAIQGQPLSVSVYATPRGGTHRIDRYEGSIEVGGQIYDKISDTQRDSIMARHESITARKLEALNMQLPGGLKISKEQYDAILRGNMPSELSAKGLEITRPAKFFEARAMIHGNICMNRVEGIAYPTFMMKTQQAPQSQVTVGSSAPISREIGTVTEVGVGLAFGIPWVDKTFGSALWGSDGNQSSQTDIGWIPGGGNAGGGKS